MMIFLVMKEGQEDLPDAFFGVFEQPDLGTLEVQLQRNAAVNPHYAGRFDVHELDLKKLEEPVTLDVADPKVAAARDE